MKYRVINLILVGLASVFIEKFGKDRNRAMVLPGGVAIRLQKWFLVSHFWYKFWVGENMS